jgi:hypothetical protein
MRAGPLPQPRFAHRVRLTTQQGDHKGRPYIVPGRQLHNS